MITLYQWRRPPDPDFDNRVATAMRRWPIIALILNFFWPPK